MDSFKNPKAALLNTYMIEPDQPVSWLQSKINPLIAKQPIKHIILVSGISGSGKTTAIRFLEDIGYYCVDNLPVNLIQQLLAEVYQQNAQIHALKSQQSYFSSNILNTPNRSDHSFDVQHINQSKEYIAIGVDIRTNSLERLPSIIQEIKQIFDLDCLFLDASDEVILKRFAQTRRKHPISQSAIFWDEQTYTNANALIQLQSLQHDFSELEHCLMQERENLSYLQEIAYKIDTSYLQSAELKNRLQQWLTDKVNPSKRTKHLLITVQSFGFKYGLPSDCDFVFDARHLPNPYYEEKLRMLTGLDQAVIDFLKDSAPANHYFLDIINFITCNLEAFVASDRAYLNIGIGCTGGQHRSVYLSERLAKSIQDIYIERALPVNVQVVHRCITWHSKKQ